MKPNAGGLPSAVALPEHIWNDGNFPWPGQDAGLLGRKFDPWLIHCDPSSSTFKIDALFERHAKWQYTRNLLFSDVVNLMSLVVCGIRPSFNSAFKKMAPMLGVTRKAVYDKIDRIETTTDSGRKETQKRC